MNAAIYTLGCKVNQYESRALSELLVKNGINPVPRGAEICIVNTCAVTAESERKCRQTVRRAMKENPGAYILVTGCAAQVNAPSFAAIKGVDYINGNRKKTDLVGMILLYREKNEKTRGIEIPNLDLLPYEEMTVSSSERTRAYMKIEDGCDSKCAYCIIKDARGGVRSRPLSECIEEAERLAKEGYREIVLTGIEVSAYGKDLENTDLSDLILALDGIEGLERIRLSSIDPSFLRPSFTEKVKNSKKLAPHMHLSLQSGCDETLIRMRRKYNTEIAKRNIDALRKAFPDMHFTADVIVGFPGETEEEFEKTLAFLTDLPLLHTHVFPFSARPGTEAETMDGQVPEEIKKERSARAIAHCDSIRDRLLMSEIGKTYPVLFESGKKGYAVGHTPNFIEVSVKTSRDLRDDIKNVRLISHKDGIAEGILTDGEPETK